MSPINLGDVFFGLASHWPDRPAVVSSHLTLTYAQLLSRAAQAARELRKRDIVPGARVGVAIRDGAETIVSLVAIWMAGAVAVPIDFRANAAERSQLAREFDMVAILEDRQTNAAGYTAILVDATWPEVIARHDATPLWPQAEDALAIISLTSGTTARPVGIALDHERMLLRSLSNFAPMSGKQLLNPLPLSFSASRTHTLAVLLQGGTVYFHPVIFSAGELADAILTRRVDSVCAVPTIVRGLIEGADQRSSPLFEGLSAFYCFGAPMLPHEKLQAKAGLCSTFVQEYGSSICGRITSLQGADIEARPESVGRVLPHVALQIVDEEDRVLPRGESGTIRLRSPGMARTILGEPRKSGDKLKGSSAYPGDIGMIDGDGFVHLLGRTSDLIIRGGANVNPAEIEAVLAKHHGIREVAVVGFSKLREGEEIAAFVVGAKTLTENDLRAHCRAHLVPDKHPRRFVFVNELPRNTNGKISRTKLREQLEIGT